ncbi:hypothetical protein C2R22_00390 [Salinigranum rubrum]|uniref:Uncharacterized protein n=1 Tax=Salinigranum rubrum TaxID=755307 RepID=A0A2I8VPJ2_9EURY|nr:hypothetical protein C2R22_00390 [Salinigranum rubrum]
MKTPHKRALLTTIVACSLVFSGCLTLSPTVSADTNNSTVVEHISATEPWSGPGIRTKISLKSSDNGSNVTTITAIEEDGQTFQSTQVDAGQTTVILSLPAHQDAILVASNSVNSTTIEKLNVTTSGRKVV